MEYILSDKVGFMLNGIVCGTKGTVVTETEGTDVGG